MFGTTRVTMEFYSTQYIPKVGGLRFLMGNGKFTVSKSPPKLPKFYQQALRSWKLCYVHNFSPHKELLWNNGHITITNKSIYKESWIERDIIFFDGLV